MRRLSLAAAIVALGALVLAGSAQACSCAQMAPGEAIQRADAAIVGELVEVVPRGAARADYRYRVQRVYKRGPGISRDTTVSVRSAMDSAGCGLPHRTGRRYGLLLVRGEGRWSGGLCGLLRPRQLDSAAQERFHCAS